MSRGNKSKSEESEDDWSLGLVAIGGAALLGVGALIGAGVHQVLSEMEKEEQAQKEASQSRGQGAKEEQVQREAWDNTREQEDKKPSERLGECRVCMDSPLEVALEPCGHTVCTSCSGLIQSCPICRARIQGRKRIYL